MPSGDDHEIGFQFLRPMRSANHRPCRHFRTTRPFAAVQHHTDAQIFDLSLKIRAARGIELAFHQRVHQMNNGHIAAAHLKSSCRLQTKQTAADDHGFQSGASFIEELARVV